MNAARFDIDGDVGAVVVEVKEVFVELEAVEAGVDVETDVETDVDISMFGDTKDVTVLCAVLLVLFGIFL